MFGKALNFYFQTEFFSSNLTFIFQGFGGFFWLFLLLYGLFQFSLWLQLSLPLHLRLQGAAEE